MNKINVSLRMRLCRERVELEQGCLEIKQELAAVHVTLQQVIIPADACAHP